MADTDVIAEALESILTKHTIRNGTKETRQMWFKFALEVVIAVALLAGGYMSLRNDVDLNTATIKEECKRSATVDSNMAKAVNMLGLQVNTIETNQFTAMKQQEKVDNKLDKVLERLPVR